MTGIFYSNWILLKTQFAQNLKNGCGIMNMSIQENNEKVLQMKLFLNIMTCVFSDNY